MLQSALPMAAARLGEDFEGSPLHCNCIVLAVARLAREILRGHVVRGEGLRGVG